MKTKPIIIVSGEPKSIFFEIFFKSQRLYKSKSPIVLISSKKILKSQMKKLKFKKKLNLIDYKNFDKFQINNNSINLIDIDLNIKKPYIFIKECFDIAFKIINSNLTYKFINGPVNKSKFLNKKYLGITEYISKKFKIKKNAMLIYNKDLSVCPITTHLPIKLVSKKISQNLIKEKVTLIDDFFKKNMGFKPKIGVAGLNPHCESILKLNEDIKIVSPAIKNLKSKGFKIYGPFPTDTLFLKQNRKKYDVILGMYHDQVLTPLKTLKEYDAINITLGLPFYRISPDHGPNIKMFNQNLSTPISLIKAIQFLDRR